MTLAPLTAGFLGAAAAFAVAGLLAWRIATAPVGFIAPLLRLLSPDLALAGAVPDPLALILSRLLFGLAVLSLLVAGLSALRS